MKPKANEIYIVKLDGPEASGDWHDKPLKWKVCGPGSEVQKFSTKKDATEYKSARRDAESQQEAIHNYSL